MVIASERPIDVRGLSVSGGLLIEDQAVLGRCHSKGSVRNGFAEELLCTCVRIVGHEASAEIGLYRVVELIRPRHPTTATGTIGKSSNTAGPLIECGRVESLQISKTDRRQYGKATTGRHADACQGLPGEAKVHAHILDGIGPE